MPTRAPATHDAGRSGDRPGQHGNGSTVEPADASDVIRDGLAAHLPDIDPEETAEWLESFDAVLDAAGQQRARYLMLRMLAAGP